MSDAAPQLPPPEAQPAAAAPDASERPSTQLRRDADLLGRRDSACRKWLVPKIRAMVEAIEAQASRSDDLDNWWNIYNCEIDDNQFYNGNAQIYVPIIRDAINARVTRHGNQLFPNTGRYIDCTASDGKEPVDQMALVNHYIREMQLESQIVRPLLRNGDIEGHYHLYVDWIETRRQLVSRETRGPIDPGTGVELPGQEIETIREEDVTVGRPAAQVLHDSDVVVWPATADTLDQAFSAGGGCVIVRRWSKTTQERLIEAGEIEEGDEDGDGNAVVQESLTGLKDLPKQLAKAIGVRAKGPHCIMLEAWLLVPLGPKGNFSRDGEPRLCRLWWDLERQPRGLKRNPFWNDRCPLLSYPLEKTAGLFKGKSLVEPLAQIQYEANDAANERADADHYGAMPIIARKPTEGNAPLILNLAAIWDVAPGDVQFMAFPDLSQRANARIMAAISIIQTSLGVNPAMIPGQTGRPGTRRNQAEIAMEQAVDLLTVSEAVKVPTVLLTDLVQWIVDLDHQFRDRDIMVRRFGELGVMAEMETVPPLRNRSQYWFAWAGAEQTRQNVAMQQQGTALLNVSGNMAQQLMQEGYQLRVGPALEMAFTNVFGPLVGSRMLLDRRHQLAMHSEPENEMLADGFDVPVHPLDDDQAHIQSHRQAMLQTGDPHGLIRAHIQAHLVQMRGKAAAMVAQQMQQALPPPAAGAPAGPTRPQPGGQPAGPRLMRGPPGMVRPDNLPQAGALTMPRRM